ncbi:hypothetical protein LINGRAHAP2_LOCUS34822 [Linum grandiflorum]
MRIRVQMDVRKSLQREKNVKKPNKEILATLKYEKLPTFCFLCGRIGHVDRYCPIRWRFPEGADLVKLWDASLRAPFRKSGKETQSPYLVPSTAEKRAMELRAGGGNSNGRRGGIRQKSANIQELTRNFRTGISANASDGNLDMVTMEDSNGALTIPEDRKRRKRMEGQERPMDIDKDIMLIAASNERQGSKNLVLAGLVSETCPPQ